MKAFSKAALAAIFICLTAFPAAAANRVLYPAGIIPQSSWFNTQERYQRLGDGALMATLMGTSGGYYNLVITPTSGLNVEVGIPTGSNSVGTLYQYLQDDASTVGTGPVSNSTALPADATQILIQGTTFGNTSAIGPLTVPVANSQISLIECQISTADANASSDQFIDGFGNRFSDTINRDRVDGIACQAKAGTAAASPTVPAADTGWIGVGYVTVPSGTSTITTDMIKALPAIGINVGSVTSTSNTATFGGVGGPTLSLGLPIAPSGTCVNGSLATVQNGGATTTFYYCYSNLWGPTSSTTPASLQSCIASIVNGSPLPLCVATTFFPGTTGSDLYRRIIPSSPTVDSNSAAMITAYFGATGGSKDVINGLVWHNGSSQSVYSFGRPLYVAASTDPLVNVTCNIYCPPNSTTVRIPSLALREGGSDQHIAILQPNGTLADFWEWQASPTYTNNEAINSGSMASARVDGTLANGSLDPQPGWMSSGGTTAGGVVTPGGEILLAELNAGVISHELYGTVDCVSSSWYPPATQTAHICTDGRAADIPNGALLQYIPSDATIDANGSLTSDEKIIAHALHDYGLRIADTGGSGGLGIQVENQASFWAYGTGSDPFIAYAIAHGWDHTTNGAASPPVDRYRHAITDLNLPSNMRVLASGN